MPSADLPLASHCPFASNNFEAMHRRLSNVLKPHRLRRLSNVPVSGIICRANLKRISINLMRIGPSVDVWPGALEHFYLVQMPIHGAVQISLGDERVLCEGTTAAVISPGEGLRLRWLDNCAQLIVQIPRETIEARLAGRFDLKQQNTLRFQTAFDLKSSAGRGASASQLYRTIGGRGWAVFPRPALRRSRGPAAVGTFGDAAA